METLYFKPRNGTLQKISVSEVRHKAVFRYEKRWDCISEWSNSDLADIEGHKDEDDTATKNMTGIVNSLYDQCMELLSKYTHCFDSLMDFPEDFAKEIFSKAVKYLGEDTETTCKTLHLYCEAYPLTFANQCKINSILLINNYELSLPVLLSRVVKLDLSNCDLDDKHDLLGKILNFSDLKSLSLENNKLTDTGFKRLFLPMQDGKFLKKLEYIDISFNKIDMKTFNRINLIKSLMSLIVGEKDITFLDSFLFKSSFRVRKCPKFETFSFEGFAEPLLELWNTYSKVKEAPNKSSNFYSTKKMTNQHLRFKPQDGYDLPRSRNKIMLERISSSTNVLNVISKKRKVSSHVEDQNKKMKASNEKVLCADLKKFEEDLLNLYS